MRNRLLSNTSTDSQVSSEDDPDVPAVHTISRSIFSKNNNFQQSSDVEAKTENIPINPKKSHDKTYTPVIGKKKLDLYKLSIIQNASKFAEPIEKTGNKTEEVKQSDLTKIRNTLTETLKEQKGQIADVTRSKTANLKSIMNDDPKDVHSQDISELNLFSARKLLFGPGVDDQTLNRHVKFILRGLNYSLKLLKGPPLSYIESRQIVLKDLKSKNQVFNFFI